MTSAGLRMEGPRVHLRPAREDDLPLIGPLRAAGSGSDGDVLVITRAGEDRAIGVLQYRVGQPSEAWATTDHVALTEDARRWGLGQEAVRQFEEQASRRWRVRRFLANVDVRQGLALYFWLRLGYRPLGAGRDGQGHDVLQMVRASD